MRFSTRSTYGLRAMIRLARSWGKDSVSLSSIAKAENISLGYLERLFSKLKKGGLIKSEKGAAGGYKLTTRPAKIKIFDIIRILEGEAPSLYCLGKNSKVYCNSKCGCGVVKVLVKIQQAVDKALKDLKLSELL